jgi:hypothetical protein
VQAHAPHRGCAVDSEADLHALFASGALAQAVARSPRCRGALLIGGNSAAWFRVSAEHG